MIEKCNPSHPDKIADRIAGAIVDYAYTQEENPKVAVEVLIGHGECNIIVETDIELPKKAVKSIVLRRETFFLILLSCVLFDFVLFSRAI